jgi:hypothetical protein
MGEKYLSGSIRSGMRGMDWIGLVQDRDKWRVLVDAAMHLRVLQKRGENLD